jgi:hypothetical protein
MTGRQLTAVLQAECAAVLESINTLRQLAGAITPLIISLRNSLDNADAAASRATFNRLFRHQAQFANSYNVIERAIRQFGVIHADATIIGHIVRDPVQDDDLREQLTSNLQAVMRDYVQAYSIIKHHPLRAVDGNTQP